MPNRFSGVLESRVFRDLIDLGALHLPWPHAGISSSEALGRVGFRV